MGTVSTEERLKEIVELTRLYDVYGPLLSDHKKDIFESYVLDNYSLGEIASEVEMSRQGVRDIVQRCSKELYSYEEKLGFLKKMDLISGLTREAKEDISRLTDVFKDEKESFERTRSILDKLDKISDIL